MPTPQMYMSRLARGLAELTVRRIVIFVLLLSVVTPFLDPYAGALERQGEGARLSSLHTLHR